MRVIKKIEQLKMHFIPEESRIQRILILLKIVNNPIVNNYRMRKLRRELLSLKHFFMSDGKFDDLVDLNSGRYEIFHLTAVHMHSLGLTAMIMRTFEGIFDIMQRGNIPIIDWQSEPSALLEPEKVGKENAWDYYFLQPFGVSLRDIDRNSCTVSTLSGPSRIFTSYALFLNKRTYCEHFEFMFAFFDRFVKFTPYVQSFMDKAYNDLINPDMRVLGVSYRLGFYYSKIPDHPVQPSISDIISKTHSSLKKWNCSHIYILADSSYVIDRFREEFPEKIITYERGLTDNRKIADEFINIHNTYGSFWGYLKHTTDKELEEYVNARTPSGVRFQKHLDYLTDIYIFSRCTSAIFGVSGASALAYLLNNNRYENEYIYSLGYY